MRAFIVLVIINAALFYALWGQWDILFILSVAFFYAYKRFLTDFADRMLK